MQGLGFQRISGLGLKVLGLSGGIQLVTTVLPCVELEYGMKLTSPFENLFRLPPQLEHEPCVCDTSPPNLGHFRMLRS